MATGHADEDTASVCAVLEAMAGVKRQAQALTVVLFMALENLMCALKAYYLPGPRGGAVG